MLKWVKLRSGVPFSYEGKVAPANSTPLDGDELVAAINSVSQIGAAAIVDQDPSKPLEVDDVPHGTIREITQWVARQVDQTAAAVLALEAENAKASPRPKLVTSLEAIAHPEEPTTGD